MWHNKYGAMLTCMLSLAAVLIIRPDALPRGHSRDSEEQLSARIQSEHNPVRKAKFQIRLARIKLDQAIAAYGEGKTELGAQLLTTFLEGMHSAWQTLHDSGRNAARQSQGFKELDIALREDARLLEDLGHRLSYFDRVPVEKAQKEVEEVRSEVLRALFPGMPTPEARRNYLHPGQEPTSW
jgi:hypothetical protein